MKTPRIDARRTRPDCPIAAAAAILVLRQRSGEAQAAVEAKRTQRRAIPEKKQITKGMGQRLVALST